MKKLLLIFFVFLLFACNSEDAYKKIIIENEYRIEKVASNIFVIDSLNSYYEKVTVRMDKASYTVIFWGNRESTLWKFRGDVYFTVDIKYNEYKNKSVELDKQLLDILKKL